MRGILAPYATRGVLREFEEHRAPGGKAEFRFTWLLDRRFSLIFDPARSTLTLKDLLPNVASKTGVDQAVRDFVVDCTNKSLPAHRRLDPSKARLSVRRGPSALSLVLTVPTRRYTYAVPKLLNLCNELFGRLSMYQVQYLWEHMGVPEE